MQRAWRASACSAPAQLAGVPGVELRVISNDIGEGNRALWMMRRALEVLDGIIPRLPGAVVHR